MSENKIKNKAKDDFWDISSLVAGIKPLRSTGKDTSAVTITDGAERSLDTQNRLTGSTVIERFVSPHRKDELTPEENELFFYTPKSSLIHKVTVYKSPSSYDFYSDFVREARRLWNARAEICEYVDFFSYSPQYDQLTKAQLDYYLWWREGLRKGIFARTNLYYIYLYFYEVINAASESEALVLRDTLISVIENYSELVRGVLPKLIRWICDFSLLYRLAPPQNFSEKLFLNAGTLKEYFVNIAGDTPEGWADMLLSYCCSYDYRTSKFAKEENLILYDTHIRGAVAAVVDGLSENGNMLSKVPFEDCMVTAKAFEGALCSSQIKVTLVVEYCSFSRSHELRFLIGDAVKYAENKIRAYIGVKSKLTVYSLPKELCETIDIYFANKFTDVKRAERKKEDRQEYDALYDLPKTELDISNARLIENASWGVTRELVEAFDTIEAIDENDCHEPEREVCSESSSGNGSIEKYASILKGLLLVDECALKQLSRSISRPPEAVVDEINEIFVELMGDIAIEEQDGSYRIIEDYKDYVKEII
ncbi:MAG: TerB N-terminal domain-containing protein [Clostridia bacterium]|nr:TerB N-terminal domain-containing protein [Clostridia bacterium]